MKMTKVCPECGNSIDNNKKRLCPKCGAKLPNISSNVQTSTDQSSTVQQPPQPSLNIAPASATLATLSAQTPEPQSKRSVLGWIAIACGVIILLAILSTFITGTMSVDNYKYCTEHFPGTYYSPSSKMCEHRVTQTPTPTPTVTYQTVTTTRTISPTPTVTYQTDTTAQTVSSGSRKSGSSGQCWVNGYYRKSGTYVHGYYRRC